MSARRRARAAWPDVEGEQNAEDVGDGEDEDGDAEGSVRDDGSGWESTDGSDDDASSEDRDEDDLSSAGGDGDEDKEEEHDDDDDDDGDEELGDRASKMGGARRARQHAESRPVEDVEANSDDAPLLPPALLDAAAHFQAVRAPPLSRRQRRDTSDGTATPGLQNAPFARALFCKAQAAYTCSPVPNGAGRGGAGRGGAGRGGAGRGGAGRGGASRHGTMGPQERCTSSGRWRGPAWSPV